MGTSVATELMARDLDGALGFELAGAMLFNGSIVLDRAQPDARRSGSCAAALGAARSRGSASERVFRHQFGELFSEAHPLSDEEAADQWALICHNGGRTLGHQLIHYLDERDHATPSAGTARSATGSPLTSPCGLEDPVATVSVLAALVGCAPPRRSSGSRARPLPPARGPGSARRRARRLAGLRRLLTP